MPERKRKWGDRRDGYRLRGLDPMHTMMPYMFGPRTKNEAVLGEVIDLTAVNAYLQQKNAAGPEFKYTWFHVITAAVAKTILLRPKMNYFIAGGHYYERNKIQISFIVKRQLAENAEETEAKFVLDPEGGSPLEQVHDYVYKFVHAVRGEHKDGAIDGALKAVSYLPRPLFRLLSWALQRMEYHGIYPKSLAAGDPCYSSCFISNLGSIKMSADYHHLFDWGTISFFLVISEKKYRAEFHEDGTYTVRDTIKLGLTIDERIADGYYFAKSLRLLRHLIAHPELLEEPAATPVSYE